MFIISLFLYNITITNVEAKSAIFYEGEYIDNIYMSKYQYSSNTIYYQKARFFRNSENNEFAYCIEPFKFFNPNSNYETTDNLNYLNNNQIKRIIALAHYGYGYNNHSDTKWYAITQLLIWQTADPNSGNYYFTEGLNGKKIDLFQDEINELNYLVDNANTLPSFANQTYNIVENHELTLEDTNNIINTYEIEGENFTINNNKIIINNLKEGKYTYKLTKKQNYNTPTIFYSSENSQDLIEKGKINWLDTEINIEVTKTKIELFKIDSDTKTIIPSGNGILDGAKYNLLDENHNIIEELTIEKNNAITNNINFGKYFIKEIEPGKGYTLDSKEYEIEITKEKSKIQLILENKVIEKKIIIEKKFGENNIFYNESDISFNIYRNNELIKTITTNNDGIAEIILPYGEYTIIQQNTTEGYEKIEPINIIVDNNNEEIIELKDLKIKVPDTHTNGKKNNYYILIIVKIILLLIC